MNTRTSTWFSVKVRYPKVNEDGLTKTVKEEIVFDALSWTEAESKATEYVNEFCKEEFEITSIAKTPFKEVLFDDKERWYKCRVAFITLDERTAKEQRSVVNYLINANSTNEAESNIKKMMGDTIADYEIVSLSETKIVEVV